MLSKPKRKSLAAVVFCSTLGLAIQAAQAESQIANPASEYCLLAGGKLNITVGKDGGKAGSCTLPDGLECDEWALFRGECGPGSPISEPFAFCAEAQNTGVIPDFRTGGSFPKQLGGMMAEQGLIPEDMPAEVWKASRWRCMDGDVWACPVGANLPCSEKADLSTEPSDAMIDFCRSNPGSAFIPAYVTGRATAYSWQCADAMPTINRQIATADAQGFISKIWHRLRKPATL